MDNVVLHLCQSIDSMGAPDTDQCFVVAYDPHSPSMPHQVVFAGTESACSAFVLLVKTTDETRDRIRQGMQALGLATLGNTLPF